MKRETRVSRGAAALPAELRILARWGLAGENAYAPGAFFACGLAWEEARVGAPGLGG